MNDRSENIGLIEPLLLPEHLSVRPELMDLVIDLTSKAAKFRATLPIPIQTSLASIVRAMNCYYSNLIEGHDTHPIAIERALKGEYDTNPQKRNLQLEAKAHIQVQEWIDKGNMSHSIFSSKTMCEIHQRFCSHLPEALLWVEDPESKKKIKIIPGEFRECDVKVGHHIPVSPAAIPRFLERYESVYSRLGKSETILALAAAHHRFLWIHPFLDGNGRVARFISYATLLQVLETGGIWSVACGLARNIQTYKQHLSNCDLTRRNDLDGRGHLSQESLIEFTTFFLKVCIDQVSFMESLMEPEKLRARVLLWAKEEIEMNHIPEKSILILEKILYRGEIPRQEISALLHLTERHARRITAKLMEMGVLVSESTKSPFRLAFPADLASRWMPGLFPEG